MKILYAVFFVLASQSCRGRSIPEEQSVVSVYTTPPTTAGTPGSLDVYHQIANNIAERITSPIFRFLGFNSNKTANATEKPWNNIELLDEIPEDEFSVKPIDNDISNDRDVEELSIEALQKRDQKPEKITLYSSYLPLNDKIEINSNDNEVDDDRVEQTTVPDDDGISFDDDDFGVEEPKMKKDGLFVYVLEWFGSVIQLAWGALSSIFKSKN